MKRFKQQRYPLLAMALAMVLLADIFWLHTFAPLENRLSDAMVARHALELLSCACPYPQGACPPSARSFVATLVSKAIKENATP